MTKGQNETVRYVFAMSASTPREDRSESGTPKVGSMSEIVLEIAGLDNARHFDALGTANQINSTPGLTKTR